MQLHRKLNSLVQNLLRLVRGIKVNELETLHPLVIMVDRRFNDTIPDGLGHNLLGLLNALQPQLLLDVNQGNA